MKVRSYILALAYVVGALMIYTSTLFLFQAGYMWGRYEYISRAYTPLLIGLLCLLGGVWWIVHFVRYAYLGQEIEVKDLPKRRYNLVGRNMHNLILEEDVTEWVPFGRRRYCVYTKEEVRYERTYKPSTNNLKDLHEDDYVV